MAGGWLATMGAILIVSLNTGIDALSQRERENHAFPSNEGSSEATPEKAYFGGPKSSPPFIGSQEPSPKDCPIRGFLPVAWLISDWPFPSRSYVFFCDIAVSSALNRLVQLDAPFAIILLYLHGPLHLPPATLLWNHSYTSTYTQVTAGASRGFLLWAAILNSSALCDQLFAILFISCKNSIKFSRAIKFFPSTFHFKLIE